MVAPWLPVQRFLVNIAMEYLNDIALSTTPYPPKRGFRYVKVTPMSRSGHKSQVEEFHAHLNSNNSYVQFIVKLENGGSIA